MKKYVFGTVCFFVITVSVFGQVDKSQYKAIDPFDYKLDEEKAAKGRVEKFINPPAAAQRVTIYYTATKGIIDSLILDEIDYANSTEEGIGLRKSAVPASSGIRKTDYKEIDLFDYKIDAEQAQRDAIRKYKSAVKFSSQDGIRFSFISLDDGTRISPKVSRRFSSLAPNQKVTIYFTATKGVVDSLALDDIEF